MNDSISEVIKKLNMLEEQDQKKSEIIKELKNQIMSMEVDEEAGARCEIELGQDDEESETLTEELLNESNLETDKEILITPVDEAFMIAVAGTESRVGTTHHAISMAGVLSRNQKKVAVADFNCPDDYLHIAKAFEEEIENEYFAYQNVDYYPGCSLIVLDKIARVYDYIIIDLGVFTDQQSLFFRSDMKIICSGGKAWELEGLQNVFTQISKTILEECKFLFNFVPEHDKGKILKGMYPLSQIYFSDFILNPFRETDGGIAEIFQEHIEVLEKPAEKKEKRIFLMGGKSKDGKKSREKRQPQWTRFHTVSAISAEQ